MNKQDSSTKQTTAAQLVGLRLLVGYLGERTQFGWWPTAFFEPSARGFLEPPFPKTVNLARYHGVVEAARVLHDAQLNVGSYHLFRMPEEVEQDAHALLLRGEYTCVPPESLSRQTSMEELGARASGSARNVEGPTSVGKFKDAVELEHLSSMAAAYHRAFSSGVRIYPYLSKTE